ncbi:hypothetical protein DPMN_159625 [Dreissena polymorpha]|uniref:Integrase core domain-containing protein n=1 Tax=Dreissena polymorpha TaxID=45954 RepID=A0A9D4ENM7_DREPO|nr:hypothetical protein DPMN_159625 [Dreissena polymorpha]
MIMFIRALDNNRADTLLQVFTQGVAESGIPLRVRTDKGMENVKIADFMLENRGNGSMITGKSVHNQRVERMWRDVYEGSLGFYSELFSFLEDEGKLNIMNPLHIYALHYVYMQKINEKLKIWKDAWNTHRLRTVGASPLKLWTSGMINSPVPSQDTVSADNDDMGIVSDISRPIFGRTEVQISDTCCSALARECPKDWSSSNYGIELFEKAISILEVNQI